MNTKTTTIQVMDKAALEAAIKSIASMGKKYDKAVHEAAVSCLSHLAQHGDVGFCNRLYLALGKGTRKAALSSWFLSHGALIANTEGNKAEMSFKYTKEKATDVEAGALDPWYDHKPDATPDTVFDLSLAIEAIIKRAKGKTLVHAEMLVGLQALMTVANGDKASELDADPVDEKLPEEA